VKATRRNSIRILIGTALSGLGAAFEAVRYLHSSHPEDQVWAKVWIGLCILCVTFGIFQGIFYWNRRDYFAEEMEHRRSLLKKSADDVRLRNN